MEQKEIKTAAGDYFFNYYDKVFKERTENYQNQLNETVEQITEVISYIRINFTEIPIFGKLDFETLDSVSISSYLKTHGSFYVTLAEQAFVIKLKELQKLVVKKARTQHILQVHKRRYFNKAEFKWLIKESTKLMVDQMIERGKKFVILNQLGYFWVKGRKTHPTERIVDHYATKKNRQRIEAEGRTVKSLDNPEGVPYIIYNTNQYFYRLRWMKSGIFEGFDFKYKFKSAGGVVKQGKPSLVGRILKLVSSKPEIKLLYR